MNHIHARCYGLPNPLHPVLASLQTIRNRLTSLLETRPIDGGTAWSKHATLQGCVASMLADPLFQTCTEQQLLLLAQLRKPMRYRKFATVYRDGARANLLYVLVRGIVELTGAEGGTKVRLW